MIVLLPGYVEPTRIYTLNDINGHLTLRIVKQFPEATLEEVTEHLPENQTILIDSAEPRLREELKLKGFNVIAGRL